jgi:hypothetical protein
LDAADDDIDKQLVDKICNEEMNKWKNAATTVTEANDCLIVSLLMTDE